MLVYLAYALVVMHVALGVLQSETSPTLSWALGGGVCWVLGLHAVAAVRTVGEPFFTRPLNEISFGELLFKLFRVARQFNLNIQPQLIMLQKTLLNIEGLGRELYPDLDLWVIARSEMEDIVREAKDGPEYLFISFDIDVLDPAFTPGTGTPEPGGLTPREAFPLVRRLCAESNVVGFDLVEFAPERDPTYVTGLNANRIVRECLTGIAMRKRGLTEKHYLSPKTVDDAR